MDLSYQSAALIAEMMAGVVKPVINSGVSDEDMYDAMIRSFDKGHAAAKDSELDPLTWVTAIAAAALVKVAKLEAGK